MTDTQTGGSQKLFAGADGFTRSYIDTALQLMSDDPDLPDGFVPDVEKLSTAGMQRMLADCAEFQRLHGDVISEAVHPRKKRGEWSPEALAGMDFWLTRCGHGVGFWEDDRWVEPHASAMDKTSENFGNQDLVLGDDGLIYAEGGLELGISTAPTMRG